MPLFIMTVAVLLEIVLPLFVLFKIYQRFNAVKYYTKFTFFIICTTFVSGAFIPYFLLRPRNVLNLIAPTSVLTNVSWILGIKFTVRGEKNLREQKSCVVVSNHQSSLDILAMFELWSIAKRMTVIARMLLLFLGPFGIGSWLCGLVFINKSSRDSGKQKMNEALEKLKREKTKLWVYPEGYRNHSGQIVEFKKGAFHMAVQAQVPIVPIVISSYKTFMRKDERFFGSGEVIIEALPEISTEGLTSADVNNLTERTRNLMIKKFEELNREVENKEKIN